MLVWGRVTFVLQPREQVAVVDAFTAPKASHGLSSSRILPWLEHPEYRRSVPIGYFPRIRESKLRSQYTVQLMLGDSQVPRRVPSIWKV